ncbi:MAG: biotin/lipoyl-binding protein [Acholeplasmataceae bacterium]|nr:biotin/lipoyl-binding protein [Acholeplasmataceae bacterium]
MKIYRVKVNGKLYEVELESVEEKAESRPAEPQPVVQPAPTKEGTVVKAPMQGNIIQVKVATGAHVNKGDVLVVLEAMKLENDIVSPASGIVREVLVSKGQNVANQQPLVIIG